MLRVRTSLRSSGTDGIGLIADQFIPRNTVVWEFNPLIDLKLSGDEIETLAEGARQQVQKYSYRDELSGLYIFCGDDARFFTRSDTPNCINVTWGPFGGRMIASRDIKAGEELSCSFPSLKKDRQEGRYRLPERRTSKFAILPFNAERRPTPEN